MAKHIITNPVASTLLGDPAVVISYNTDLTSEYKFNGNPYSEINCLAPHLGELVRVTVPGVVEGLTSEMAQEACCRLAFVRVRFSNDLALELKADSFNKLTYVATAGRAALVQPGQE